MDFSKYELVVVGVSAEIGTLLRVVESATRYTLFDVYINDKNLLINGVFGTWVFEVRIKEFKNRPLSYDYLASKCLAVDPRYNVFEFDFTVWKSWLRMRVLELIANYDRFLDDSDLSLAFSALNSSIDKVKETPALHYIEAESFRIKDLAIDMHNYPKGVITKDFENLCGAIDFATTTFLHWWGKNG